MNAAIRRHANAAQASSAPDAVRAERRRGIVLALDTAQTGGGQIDELNRRLRWMEIRAKLIDPEIASHGGHILKGALDGFLAEFRTASEAVRCAIELQRDISAASATLTALPSIELRIAIAHGALSAIGGEVEGEAIDRALALRKGTELGAIAIDRAIREQIAAAPGTKETFAIVPAPGAGERETEFRIAVPALGAQTPLARTQPRRQASVAVLPFKGGVGGADDYFTGGIVESIVGLLAGVSDLVVVSRESTLMFRGDAVDLKAVGRQLAVRYLVTGAARRSGDRLRLDPRLIDTETDKVLWSARYEVRLSRLFDLQDHISRRIVRALVPNLSAAELRRVETKRPESLDAYDLVLQAMDLMQRLNREEFAIARMLLEHAVAKDPGYAAAHTLLARWYMLNLGQGYSVREHTEKNSFLKAVARAVELNPEDAHALALLGHCKSWLFRDYDAALDCFERAFAASPNSAFAWGWSSPTCSYLGDGQTAIAHAEHALRLSPYGPNGYVYRSALALAHYTDGNYEEAARWGRRTMAIAPGYSANLRILAASLAAAGNLEEAKTVGRSILSQQPDFGARRIALGYSYKAKERNLALAEHLKLAGLPD